MRGKIALTGLIFSTLQLLGAVTASAQTIQRVAGGGLHVNRPALQISVKTPSGVAYAPDGSVYLIDGNQVDKLDPSTGLITTVAGNGAYGNSGDGGAATNAELYGPFSVAVDGAGNLYIADTFNNRIRMVSAATGLISTVAGNGTAGYSGDGGAATSAALYYPYAVAVDGAGNLYIADTDNQRIRMVSAATGVISTVAGNGTAGYSGDGGAATNAAFEYPEGIAVDGAGNLYIADTVNQRVRRVSAATGFISTVAGNGYSGYAGDGVPATNTELYDPVGVAVDGAGNLYIGDTVNNRIRMVSAATGVISTVAGDGSFGYSGDGGAATNALLAEPHGVALDGAGNLYIADTDNERIRMVSAATGFISTVAGNGLSDYSGDGGAATDAELYGPYGVALDGAGNLYIADTDNQRIRKVSAATGVISTVAGNGYSGYSGDGAAATNAELYDPFGVAVDGAGNLYIADTVNNRIRMVSAATGFISTVAGNGTAGYSGDGGAATNAELDGPYGVAVDGAGNLYIADTLNNRIRRVSAATGFISTVAGNGTAGYSGDGGAATNTALHFPQSVAVDGAGNLYIADASNQRIRMVSAATGFISTVAGNGTAGYSGDGGAATNAYLYDPFGVAVDGAGNLYIADSSNNRIRMVSAATGFISTIAGNGSFGDSGDGGAATSASLATPTGLAVGGNLYFADSSDNVIREVTGVVVSTTPPVVTPTITGTPGKNGWYLSNVQVSWTVSGPSPILSQTGCGLVTITADTSGQVLTCTAKNAGGTTTQSVTIRRDATPPTISIVAPANGQSYTIGSTIAASYSCADAVSGIASCIGTVANGAPIGTAGTGNQSFKVTATDVAGNVTQTTVGYSVSLASQTISFGAIASQAAGTMLALQASASSGLPVTFASSTTNVCTVSGNTASLLGTGTCKITASQIGNADYAPATPVSQSFTVMTADSVTLGIASGTQKYGVYNNFSIGPSYKGSPVPTGTVTLYDNTVALVSLKLGGNGVAYYTASPLNAGVNVMTASYSGDSHYAASVSAPVTLNVTPAPVNLGGSCWGGTPYKVAYQCVVTVSAATATPPTGSISYSLDGAAATSVALSNGSASFTVPTLPAAGAHKLTITYAGQGNYAAGTPLTESFTTAPGQTQLLISPSSYYLAAGSPLTLTVTASTPQSGVPTGSVTFYDNGVVLGTATIGANGVATYPVAKIPTGANTYTAKYAATANYAAATSNSGTVTAH